MFWYEPFFWFFCCLVCIGWLNFCTLIYLIEKKIPGSLREDEWEKAKQIREKKDISITTSRLNCLKNKKKILLSPGEIKISSVDIIYKQ